MGRRRRRRAKLHQLGSGKEEEEEEDVETATHDPVPELPGEIVVDILSRLPIKSIFICRRVCKLWLSLISGADFAQLHLSRSQVSFLIKSFHKKGNPRLFQLVDLTTAPLVGSRNTSMKLRPRRNLPRDPNIAFNLLNCCNGLLCLCEPETNDPIYVCNPILGEYVTLPKCDSRAVCFCHNSAFGFSPTTNEYKVVRTISGVFPDPVTGSVLREELEIYTLGEEGSWRSKGKPSMLIRNNSFNAFFNGAFHWISFTHMGLPDPICCFDFASELFRAVPEPSEFTSIENYSFDFLHIGVLQECLSICNFSRHSHTDIWLMKRLWSQGILD